MIRWVSIIVLLSILLPGIIKTWIYIDFKVHQQRITETLCINREKPITVCGGSCYLSKELRDFDPPTQKQLPEVLKLKTDVQLISETHTALYQPKRSESTPQQGSKNNPVYSQLFAFDIFHPPRLA